MEPALLPALLSKSHSVDITCLMHAGWFIDTVKKYTNIHFHHKLDSLNVSNSWVAVCQFRFLWSLPCKQFTNTIETCQSKLAMQPRSAWINVFTKLKLQLRGEYVIVLSRKIKGHSLQSAWVSQDIKEMSQLFLCLLEEKDDVPVLSTVFLVSSTFCSWRQRADHHQH